MRAAKTRTPRTLSAYTGESTPRTGAQDDSQGAGAVSAAPVEVPPQLDTLADVRVELVRLYWLGLTGAIKADVMSKCFAVLREIAVTIENGLMDEERAKRAYHPLSKVERDARVASAIRDGIKATDDDVNTTIYQRSAVAAAERADR
jgi:hypothetical protein